MIISWGCFGGITILGNPHKWRLRFLEFPKSSKMLHPGGDDYWHLWVSKVCLIVRKSSTSIWWKKTHISNKTGEGFVGLSNWGDLFFKNTTTRISNPKILYQHWLFSLNRGGWLKDSLENLLPEFFHIHPNMDTHDGFEMVIPFKYGNDVWYVQFLGRLP